MTRRFNLHPVPAGEIEDLSDRAAAFVFRAQNNHVRNGDVAGAHWRARKLLLHWWAVGHDPRRALDRCEDCRWEGTGLDQRSVEYCMSSYDEVIECKTCKGTGRAAVSEWRKL